MIEFFNSIVHSVVEIVMEKQDSKKASEPKPMKPLTEKEHKNMLVRMYCILGTISLLLGSLVSMK